MISHAIFAVPVAGTGIVTGSGSGVVSAGTTGSRVVVVDGRFGDSVPERGAGLGGSGKTGDSVVVVGVKTGRHDVQIAVIVHGRHEI